MDTRMLDTLSRQRPGTLETPVNNFDSPAGITSAVGVGLFYNPDRMEQTESDLLGAEAVALMLSESIAFH